MPSVVGIPEDEARATLEGAGFKVKVVTRNSDVPVGNVIDQSPAPGTKLQPGTTVTLIVSSGPAVQQNPDDGLPTEPPMDDLPTDDGEDDGAGIDLNGDPFG